MLQVLLDEHVSRRVAVPLNRAGYTVRTLQSWENGRFRSTDDELILQAAAQQGLTLVTYDLRTIPAVLKSWNTQGLSRGGVIFVDERTLAPSNIGSLVRALTELFKAYGTADWTDRVLYLRRDATS